MSTLIFDLYGIVSVSSCNKRSFQILSLARQPAILKIYSISVKKFNASKIYTKTTTGAFQQRLLKIKILAIDDDNV